MVNKVQILHIFGIVSSLNLFDKRREKIELGPFISESSVSYWEYRYGDPKFSWSLLNIYFGARRNSKQLKISSWKFIESWNS